MKIYVKIRDEKGNPVRLQSLTLKKGHTAEIFVRCADHE